MNLYEYSKGMGQMCKDLSEKFMQKKDYKLAKFYESAAQGFFSRAEKLTVQQSITPLTNSNKLTAFYRMNKKALRGAL